MSLRPSLNVVCNRCGKPRGLTHTCFSNSKRKATLKPALSFGTCPKCKKQIANPLTHTCAPKSDFKRRKSRFEKQPKARKKRQAEKHDYQACSDKDCPRSLCVAYKTGWKQGREEGYERGFEQGYDAGFPDGIEACPLPHQ